MLLAELFEVELGQRDDASVFTDEFAPDFDGAGSTGSGAQEDGEKFFVGECGDSQSGHFFARLLIIGEILDSGAVGHLQRSIEIPWKSSKLSVAGLVVAAIRLIPLALRDGIYREIARRRKSHAKASACPIPEAHHKGCFSGKRRGL